MNRRRVYFPTDSGTTVTVRAGDAVCDAIVLPDGTSWAYGHVRKACEFLASRENVEVRRLAVPLDLGDKK